MEETCNGISELVEVEIYSDTWGPKNMVMAGEETCSSNLVMSEVVETTYVGKLGLEEVETCTDI